MIMLIMFLENLCLLDKEVQRIEAHKSSPLTYKYLVASSWITTLLRYLPPTPYKTYI